MYVQSAHGGNMPEKFSVSGKDLLRPDFARDVTIKEKTLRLRTEQRSCGLSPAPRPNKITAVRSFLSPIIPSLLFAGVALSAPAPTPVVSQVHVLSIHVPDHAAFDAVFFFFRDVVQLPPVYGEPSQPGNKEKRLYAGFSVGNAYLEPCGPYPSDAPFSSNRPARFHGLTFSPATTLAENAQDLTRRGISHSGCSEVEADPALSIAAMPRCPENSCRSDSGRFRTRRIA